MPFLSNLSDIRLGETGHIFEGFEFGDVNISFFFTDAEPGQGPALHYHPYEEVFVILDGQATFTIDGETLVAHKGDILLAPAYAHHKFVNSGQGQLSTINVHPSDRIVQVMVEE
jgi:mannose-6-phosphate isomerase-like protein (cupin superfamily)